MIGDKDQQFSAAACDLLLYRKDNPDETLCFKSKHIENHFINEFIENK